MALVDQRVEAAERCCARVGADSARLGLRWLMRFNLLEAKSRQRELIPVSSPGHDVVIANRKPGARWVAELVPADSSVAGQAEGVLDGHLDHPALSCACRSALQVNDDSLEERHGWE